MKLYHYNHIKASVTSTWESEKFDYKAKKIKEN